ncbi:unnamed protein product [Rhizophagus irregularis]|nr:unnamed protein product [Rhizophagus irregularis]
MSQTYVILVELGSLIENLHYGPYSRYWWEILSIPDANTQLRFPIRAGQKTNACLNGRDFYIIVQISSSNQMLPEYFCQSGEFWVIETSATKAVSEVYQNIFQKKTRYSGSIIMGWDNKNIIDVLSSNIDFCPFSCKLGDYEIFIYGLGSSTRSDWNQAGNGYKSSIIHTYKKRKELFGLEDQITLQKLNKLRIPQCAPHEWNNFKLMKKLYEYHLQRQTFAKIEWYKLFVRWDQNECNVIELNSELKLLYPPEHQFSDRELGAWLSMLRAAGCSDITPWSMINLYQLWTKSRNPIQEKQIFTTLYKMGFLSSNPSNSTETFWSCFRQALDDNKKPEMENGVASYTVLESRRHAVLNGFGAPPIEKPKFHRLKFKIEQIDQFDSFFMRKDIVNMSSYRTHSKSGLPIMYLQDHKQALWEKFSEEYPNGMRRTAFMTRLQGSRFVYQII